MHKITFFIFILIFLNCKSSQNATDGENTCNTFGIVADYTGKLDGCKFLIELENGEKFNPVKIQDESFVLKDGQRISFGYTELDDMMSNCMAESAFIEITCIKEVKVEENPPSSCIDTKNPFEVDWMNKAIDSHNPNQILKYKADTRWAYLFKGLPDSYLYDCEGKFLCKTTGVWNDDCHKNYLDKYPKGKIIWEGEGIWD